MSSPFIDVSGAPLTLVLGGKTPRPGKTPGHTVTIALLVDKKMRVRKWILENEYCLCPGEGWLRMYRRRKPSTALSRNLRKRVLPSNPRLSYSCAFAVRDSLGAITAIARLLPMARSAPLLGDSMRSPLGVSQGSLQQTVQTMRPRWPKVITTIETVITRSDA